MDVRIIEPEEVRRQPCTPIVFVVGWMINHAADVVAAAEHRIRPAVQSKPFHYFIRDEKEAVRPCDDTNIDFSDVLEADKSWIRSELIEEGAFGQI